MSLIDATTASTSMTLTEDTFGVSCHAFGRISVSAANGTPVPRGDLPGAIPRAQVYFWSQEWQSNELAAEREILEGRSVRFENPADALDVIHWLLSDDD